MMKKQGRKQVLFSLVIALVFLFACDQKPKNPVAEYGDALIDSYKRGQQAGGIANLDAVKKAVQVYHAENDKYPQSLDEIKDSFGSNIDLSKYDYDPVTGTVSIKEQY